MHRSSVDRPEPGAPTIAAASPRSTCRSTPRKTEIAPEHEPAPAVNRLWRPMTSSAGDTLTDSAQGPHSRHQLIPHTIKTPIGV